MPQKKQPQAEIELEAAAVAVIKENNMLAAFAAAAAILPGISQNVHAGTSDPDVRSEKIQVKYTHGMYSESDNRMDVKIDQLTLTAPLADRWEISLNAIKDKTSGASPFAYLPRAGGIPTPIISSRASIRDERGVFDATVKYYGDEDIVSVNVGFSREDDYESDFASVSYQHKFNNKATSLMLSAAYADDTSWNSFGPTDLFKVPAVFRDRNKLDLMAGFSQIIDANSVAQFNLTYSNSTGDLSDPYKSSFVSGTGFVSDNRPSDRKQWIAFGRYSRYFEDMQAAVHISYRHAEDSWNANSDTLTVKWAQEIGDIFTVEPNFRYYTQHSADFYGPIFSSLPSNGYTTSDYRLASFGTLTFGVDMTAKVTEDVSVTLTYRYVDRKREYQWGQSGSGFNTDDYSASIWALGLYAAF